MYEVWHLIVRIGLFELSLRPPDPKYLIARIPFASNRYHVGPEVLLYLDLDFDVLNRNEGHYRNLHVVAISLNPVVEDDAFQLQFGKRFLYLCQLDGRSVRVLNKSIEDLRLEIDRTVGV